MNPADKLILVAEDEPAIASLLEDYLRAEGFGCQVIADGGQVVDWVREQQPDLILLDLMLPNLDGLSICRAVRAFSAVPIIMVTARVEEIDRLLGLEMGADDYVCKPFSPREVVARVRAVLRRPPLREAHQAASQQLVIDVQRFEARWQEQPLNLTPVEFRLLTALAESPGRVLSRDALMEHAYTDHRVVSDRTIDSHVKNLRRKLEALDADNEWLRSVYGVGYCLNLPPAEGSSSAT